MPKIFVLLKLKQVKTHFFRKREIEILLEINIIYFDKKKRPVQLNAIGWL